MLLGLLSIYDAAAYCQGSCLSHHLNGMDSEVSEDGGALGQKEPRSLKAHVEDFLLGIPVGQ